MEKKIIVGDIFGGFFKIDKGQEFLRNYNQYLTIQENLVFWKFFNTKCYRITEKVISYRIINHWEKFGLIPKVRTEENGWRRYSIMDLVWLGVVKELRAFGLGLKEILNVRKTLISGYNEIEYGELEFYTALAYINNIPVSVLVFSDYRAEVGNAFEILDGEIKYGPYNHISININAILQSIFPNKDCKPIYSKLIDLSDEQNEILEIIRNKKVEEINISVNEGKPVQMKYTVSEPTDSNIGELKVKNTHQKISVDQVNSKTVSVKRIISKKFK